MAGIEENAPVIGDWTPINPSPRTLFSNFMAEDFSPRPFPDDPPGHGKVGALAELEMSKVPPGPKMTDGEVGMEDSSNSFSQLDVFRAPRRGPRGGLAERMARVGFTAPKLNTARIRSTSMASSSSEIRSPYLTIPPGLSPTTLLDSPVFLSNSLVQPSPTTGKFPLDLSSNMSSASVSSISSKTKDNHLSDVGAGSFAFKPHPQLSSSYFPNMVNKAVSVDDRQTLPSIKLSVQPEHPKRENQDAVDVQSRNPQDFNLKSEFPSSSELKDATGDLAVDQNVSDSGMGDEPLDDQQDGEGENKGEFSSLPVIAPSEDEYNWRKYGQKQVKGSEYPRSYYKCTHPNCQVKKKVERSYVGEITEIIYKGTHNHPKPPPNRRSAVPTSHPFNEISVDGFEIHASQPILDGKLTWDNTQKGNVGPDWKNDGVEVTSSATVSAEVCDTSSIQEQDRRHNESADAIDVSSNVSNDEDEDEQATHGSVSLGCDGEGDESESKRRKLEASAMEMNAGSRAVREPRVVVQTTSEVDILDDGYRWRKYGQKVVKGNPNPRSYYKCTNPGCTVRKHVERASHDLKSVITTYEGKHNHDVPAARNSSHASAGPSGTAATSASQAHNMHRRPEPSQDSLPRFNAPPPLGSYAPPGREQLGHPPVFSFGVGHPGLSNLGMAGLGPATQMKMLPSVHPYMGLPHVNEAGFMLPKGEPKEEPMQEASLSIPNGPAVYNQIMSRLPLGPQL